MNTPFMNVLILRQLPTTATDDNLLLGAKLSAWLNYVVNFTRNVQTGDYHIPVSGINAPPANMRVGKTLYLWIQLGFLEIVSGLDYARHFIKLPLAWKDETYSSETIIDEEGNEITITVKNSEHYSIAHENSTHVLVKLTDSNYPDFKDMIVYNQNIIAEDKYDTAIAQGGEFYKPQTETT